MSDYPYLKELTNDDLISLLGEYVRTPALIKEDGDFIKALQAELKTRKFKPENLDTPGE